MTSIDPHEIHNRSGHTIHAAFFHPQDEAKTSVVIVPAMGTVQEYYVLLACWLDVQGNFVATFDYSGPGRSLTGDLRQSKGDIIDWARFDCDAMLGAISGAVPIKPLYWVGHSLGERVGVATIKLCHSVN